MIGSTSPAASPASSQRSPAACSRRIAAGVSDGIGQLYLVSARSAAGACASNPSPRGREEVAARGFVRLSADADRQMIGPREGPQVPGRGGRELDVDVAAGPAVHEVAARDGQVAARERRRDAAANQAVGAVGAEQPCRGQAIRLGLDRPGAAGPRERHDPPRHELRAADARRIEQCGVEIAPRHDRQRRAARRARRRRQCLPTS